MRLRTHTAIRPHGQAVKTSPFHGGNSGSSPDGVTKAVLHELLFFQRRVCRYVSIVMHKKARENPLLFCFPLEWKKSTSLYYRHNVPMSAIGAAVRRSGAWGSSPTRRDRSARQVACRLRTSPFSLKFLPNFSTPARRSKICDNAQIFENYADGIFISRSACCLRHYCQPTPHFPQGTDGQRAAHKNGAHARLFFSCARAFASPFFFLRKYAI